MKEWPRPYTNGNRMQQDPKGRPRVRCEDSVRNDLRKMGVTDWKQRTQGRRQWKEIIEQAKTHKEL
jgi:hypothetical protein